MKTSITLRRVWCRIMFVLAVGCIFNTSIYAQVPVNDLCANATPLSSSNSCNVITGTLTNATVSAPAVATTCGTAGADVWYVFTAQSVYPRITLSNHGASLPAGNARIQIFHGPCGTAALGCVSGSLLNTTTVVPAGLIPGDVYYIRVYSNTAAPAGPDWNFDICVQDPPSNDLCTNATILTPAISCNAVTGTLNNAAISNPAITTTCGTAGGDVWFKFAAGSSYPTITLSNHGASLPAANARIQLFSGVCGGLTSLACVSGSILSTSSAYAAGLTPGDTFYVRIYSNTAAPTGGAGWNFDICVQEPPVNDLITNATPLTPAIACNTTTGTLTNAAISNPALATTCGTAGADVWYSFVAQSAYPTITLSNHGASLPAGNARIQLFAGPATSPTALACVNGSLFTTSAAYPTGLIPGDTYYIRIYSNTLAPQALTWNFDICLQNGPANDLCDNATILTSGLTCTPTTATLTNAGLSNPAVATTCGTATADVWFKFAAQSSFPRILLSNHGTSFTAGNARIQLFSGTCGSLTSLGCANGSTLVSASVFAAGLTIGDTFYVRVYSSTTAPTGVNWNFDICIQDAPVNDLCSGATILTSGATCIPVSGTLNNAAPSNPTIATTCGSATTADVWYKFAATSPYPYITLSNHGVSFVPANARIQLFSGSCGSLTSLGCASGSALSTGSVYAPGLTIGDTFYIRIYSTTTLPAATTWGFDICVVNIPPPPANDDCVNAALLTSSGTCSNTAGTLFYATPTAAVPGDCGDPSSPEVWYRFVATSKFPSITLSGIGAQFTAAGTRIQLLSGTCGGFTSLACGSGTVLSAGLYPGGLTIGNTYYVRIYSNTSTASMTGNGWNFNICITDPASPSVDYGKSYVNVTKGSNGGTIEPGDVLEIRATIAVRSNWAFNVSFDGIIPANTTYIPNTLRILTNEGKIYKQWTDAADGDAGTLTGSAVHINLGNGAIETWGGAIRAGDRPVFGGVCIMIASYRVTVNAVSFGSTISVGGGSYTYENSGGTPTSIVFPDVTALVYQNYGICTDVVGSNGILSENGGSFGAGTTKDRPASGNVPSNYSYTGFSTNNPADYKYGISNNTSTGTAAANYSIDPNDPDGNKRVFAVWDIIGDHTGAASPTAGNLPADVNNGQSGGYMVVINAAFRTDTAFLDTVRNLCPNTSYEYSAWFRNICRRCGVDSAGVGPSSGSYSPTGPGDSSGVHPNLTFNINGFDYYTTGDMGYTGQWIKKGFTYRTGPSETQMIISIRNNAPGGGGNDWAIDDIGVATCSPVLNITPPSPNINVCYGDGATLTAEVRSFFDNYTYWVWEKSIDSGVNWISTGFAGSGSVTPLFDGTQYVHTANGPSFIGDSSTHANIFRLRVASSAGNLADPNCSFLASRTVQVYVNNCGNVLATKLSALSGRVNNKQVTLQWNTLNEEAKIFFEVERSNDGIHFSKAGTVNGKAVNGGGSSYTFTDAEAITEATYYRIKMWSGNQHVHSNIVSFNTDKLRFDVKAINPFDSHVSFNVTTPAEGQATIILFDDYGRQVLQQKERLLKGINNVLLPNLHYLSNGSYTLHVQLGNNVTNKRLIKLKK